MIHRETCGFRDSSLSAVPCSGLPGIARSNHTYSYSTELSYRVSSMIIMKYIIPFSISANMS